MEDRSLHLAAAATQARGMVIILEAMASAGTPCDETTADQVMELLVACPEQDDGTVLVKMVSDELLDVFMTLMPEVVGYPTCGSALEQLNELILPEDRTFVMVRLTEESPMRLIVSIAPGPGYTDEDGAEE